MSQSTTLVMLWWSVNLARLRFKRLTSNWQLPHLNQRKGENGRRNDFMTNPHKRMLSYHRIKHATPWIPVGRASDRATRPGKVFCAVKCCWGLQWYFKLELRDPKLHALTTHQRWHIIVNRLDIDLYPTKVISIPSDMCTLSEACVYQIWASSREKPSSGFATRVELNWPSLPQKLCRDLKFQIYKLEVLYYLVSEQQRCWSDCADAQADLRLCCSHMAKTGFLMTWLIWKLKSGSYELKC